MGDTVRKVQGLNAAAAGVFKALAVVTGTVAAAVPVTDHAVLAVGVADGSDTVGVLTAGRSTERIVDEVIIRRQGHGTQALAVAEAVAAQNNLLIGQSQRSQILAAIETLVADVQGVAVNGKGLDIGVIVPAPVAVVQRIDPQGIGRLGVTVDDGIHHIALLIHHQIDGSFHHTDQRVDLTAQLIQHGLGTEEVGGAGDLQTRFLLQICELGVIAGKEGLKFALSHGAGGGIRLLDPLV